MKINILLVVLFVLSLNFIEAGRCRRKPKCEQITTNLNGTKNAIGCPMFKLKSDCHMKPGNLKLKFPECCPKVECPKTLPCIKWTVRNSKNRVAVTCPTFAIRPGSNCTRIAGNPKASYPGCCERPKCYRIRNRNVENIKKHK